MPVLAVAGVYTVNSLSGDATEPAPPAPIADASAMDPADLAAQSWLLANVDDTEAVVVDDAIDEGLVDEGWNLVTLIAADKPSLQWRDADYVVVTDALRGSAESSPQLQLAIDNSVVVASFGDGAPPVEVRRVTPGGATLAGAAVQAAAETRAEFGAELAANTGVITSDADRALLTDGFVDERIAVLLGALAAEGDVTVSDFPTVQGEQSDAIRQVALTALAGVPLVQNGTLTPDAAALFDGFRGDFAPQNVSVVDDAVLLRYSLYTDALFD